MSGLHALHTHAPPKDLNGARPSVVTGPYPHRAPGTHHCSVLPRRGPRCAALTTLPEVLSLRTLTPFLSSSQLSYRVRVRVCAHSSAAVRRAEGTEGIH